MPYRFNDLSGNGRHLTITNKAQLSPQINSVMPNTQGALVLTTASPTYPGIHYADPAGFFAPTWGSGDEALTLIVAVVITNSTAMFFSWSKPSNPGYNSWYFYTSGLKVYCNYGNAASTGMYLSCETTAAISAGTYIIHAEMRTGATREINMWFNGSNATALTRGGSGAPWVPDGTEIVQALSRPDGLGNTACPVGVLGFARRRLTNDERLAHVLALNAA